MGCDRRIVEYETRTAYSRSKKCGIITLSYFYYNHTTAFFCLSIQSCCRAEILKEHVQVLGVQLT